MSLNEQGRTGVKVNLTADGVFGIVTQDAESMLSSPGGLDNADGNSGFGHKFTLSSYLTKTASGTASTTLCSSDAPFKFRVLSVTLQVLDDARGRARRGNGDATVVLRKGSAGAGVAWGRFRHLKTMERMDVPLSTEGNEVVAADESLLVSWSATLPDLDKSTTFVALVEIECMRVV